ncbi:hypothetical protein ACFRH6_16865 [Streptomyces sp. NPDC056749]|uniref:hypothetical protein n=1 Tax=Streptomyces sp. NPDC056749 TaxID=3345936 RepID=UPI00368E29BB
MTTAAEPRRPSPADAARATQAAADRRLTAPAVLPAGMAFRALYERAILGSGMTPHPRLVAIALATHADAAGQITQQPRLTGLVHATGLHPGQVVVALTTLRGRGWIRQTPARARFDVADLALTIPNHVLTSLRRKTTTTETPDA